MPWKEFAPSDLDYSAAIGADQDERIALEEAKAREDAFRGDRGALLHLLIAEVQRDTERGVTPGRMLGWFASIIDGEPFSPTEQVIRTFVDLWGVGPAVEALGSAMVSVNGDHFNEVRR